VFDFPLNPLINEEVVHSAGAVYIWDGQKWRAKRNATPFEPAPLIASIDPTQANQNEAIALTVGGTYFEAATVITLDGVDAPTAYLSVVELTTEIPPQPYGKTSIAVNVRTDTLMGANADKTITLIDTRVPLITAISPTSSNQGVSFTLTVTGTGFIDTTQIVINGAAVATTFVSATSLTTQIAAQPYGAGSTRTINVTGPNPGTNPNQTLTFVDSRPVLTNISPVVGTQNEAITLTATGTFFRADTPITVNGVALTTTFVSATQLTASYTSPYFDPVELGQLDVTVNVSGSLSPSHTVNFLEPRFKIRSTFPINYTDIAPQNWEVELWGWGVISDQSVAYIDGRPQQTWVVANVVGTELILMMHMDLTPYPDDTQVMITVQNEGKHWSPDPPWPFWIERFG